MATTDARQAVLAHPHELERELSRTGTRTHEGDMPTEEKAEIERPVSVEPSLLHVSDIPTKYRLIALSCILFMTTGASFAESTLGPLKSTFMKELDINSASAGRGAKTNGRCPVRDDQHGE